MRRVICLASLPCPLYNMYKKTKTNQNHRELQQEMGKESQSVSLKTYPEEEREESRVEGNRDNAG